MKHVDEIPRLECSMVVQQLRSWKLRLDDRCQAVAWTAAQKDQKDNQEDNTVDVVSDWELMSCKANDIVKKWMKEDLKDLK